MNLNWEQAVELLRADPSQSDLVQACYYDDPLLAAAQRFQSSGEWIATRHLLGRSRGKALDIGAGRGIASFALAKDGWHVTSAEPDPSQVVGAGAIRRLAEEGDVRIDVVSNAGEKLPFDDHTFDLVYGRAVLHHAASLEKFCAELARVLKPGGRLLATREHVIGNQQELPVFLESHPLHKHYGGENAYTLGQYLGALRGGGLKIVKVLNPLASEINLHPKTLRDAKLTVARKLRLPSWLPPQRVVSFAGRFLRTPGRLYTFLASNSEDA